MKTVIMESLGIRADSLKAHMKPFEEQGMEFSVCERTDSIEEQIRNAEDADIMILANMPMKAEVLRACNNLKFVDIAFTGTDHVALDVCREKGIAVSNASGYSNEAVAEQTLGMVLGMVRNLPALDQRAREGGNKNGLVGTEIKGKTVGIIGLGRIGRRSAELFHAFGAQVIAYTRTPANNPLEYVQCTDLQDLLQRSDIVVLHCPLTDATRGMIGRNELALMKKEAILVNVARGPVVDTQALTDALKEHVIAGACIDVFDTEPPLPADEPLLHAPNTFLTPHSAFATKESMEMRADTVFDNIRAWLRSEQQNTVL